MNTRKGNRRAATLIAAAIATSAPWALSCSLDYEGLSGAEDLLAAEKPNAVLTGFSHTSVSDGMPEFRLSAAIAEQFDGIGETRLHSVEFAEFDAKTGEVIASGRADFARYFSETENAELSGNLVFDSRRDDIGLNGGYLYWNKAERKLTSRADQTISVSRSDGTSVRGEGFSADIAVKGFSFSGRTEGTWVVKDGDPESADGQTEAR